MILISKFNLSSNIIKRFATTLLRFLPIIVITKIINLEELGKFSLYTSYLSFSSGIICLGCGLYFAYNQQNNKREDLYLFTLISALLISPLFILIAYLIKIPYITSNIISAYIYLVSESINIEISRFKYTLGDHIFISNINFIQSINYFVCILISILLENKPLSNVGFLLMAFTSLIININGLKPNYRIINYKINKIKDIVINKKLISYMPRIIVIIKIGVKELINQQLILFQLFIDRYIIKITLGEIILSIYSLIQASAGSVISILLLPIYTNIRKKLIKSIDNRNLINVLKRKITMTIIFTTMLVTILMPLMFLVCNVIELFDYKDIKTVLLITITISAIISSTLTAMSATISPAYSIKNNKTIKILTVSLYIYITFFIIFKLIILKSIFNSYIILNLLLFYSLVNYNFRFKLL